MYYPMAALSGLVIGGQMRDLWNSYYSNFVTWRGRLDRSDYIFANIALAAFTVFGGALFGSVLVLAYPDTKVPSIWSLPIIIAFIALATAQISLTVRRFHDFDAPGFSVLFWLAGLVVVRVLQTQAEQASNVFGAYFFYALGLIVVFVPFFAPGTKGDNRFGRAPSASLDDQQQPSSGIDSTST